MRSRTTANTVASGTKSPRCMYTIAAVIAGLIKDKAFNDEVYKVANIHATLLPGTEMVQAIDAMLDQPPVLKEKVIGLLRSSAN